MGKLAFGLVDGQRGFMPISEGMRLGLPGFGELGVPDGEQIIAPVNRLFKRFAAANLPMFTTQDWHPKKTAHYSPTPDYNTTWPEHCVANTPGAEIHPDINIPDGTTRFVKGTEPLTRGEDDTSYSGYNGHVEETGETFQAYLDRLRADGIDTIVLGGLALDYCVKATALDIRRQGFDVIVVDEATRPVAPETGQQAIVELRAAGVQLMSLERVLDLVPAR